MSWLVQTWAIVGNPVSNPVDHLRETYTWPTKKAGGLRCIGEQCRWRFLAKDLWLLAEPLTKHLGEPSDGYNLCSRYINWSSRRGRVPQRTKRLRVCVALPNYVDVAHVGVD